MSAFTIFTSNELHGIFLAPSKRRREGGGRHNPDANYRLLTSVHGALNQLEHDTDVKRHFDPAVSYAKRNSRDGPRN